MGNGTDSRRENSYKFSHECINIKNISLQKRAAGGDRKKHRNPLSVQKLKGAAGRIGENSARHSSPKTRRRGCVQKIKRGETAVKLMQILFLMVLQNMLILKEILLAMVNLEMVVEA